MKIKTRAIPYEQVIHLKPYANKKPIKQLPLLRWLVYVLSSADLLRFRFRYKEIGMEKLSKDQPCLILMNHSCFADMEIVAKIFGKRPYQIVCTQDALVGKAWLMRLLGCIPTTKFVTDISLVKNMVHAVQKLKESVIMFPEAGYSFDGTTTTLPDSLGKCVKLLNVPVVMVHTYGAFHKTPLYNNLKNRKVNISAEVEYLLSPEEIQQKTAAELNEILKEQFSYDHFRWQQENGIKIREKDRAECLNRILYKCPHCQAEKMTGEGVYLTCNGCGKVYELTEDGFMQALKGDTEIAHIPDWYRWERDCVRQELIDGTYALDVPVDIYMMVNTDGAYSVGEGRLQHNLDGFHLTGCDGKLDYVQPPKASYTINSDFYWYEKGDVICVGTKDVQYYCIPKVQGDVVAKARLAAEELYKLAKKN